MRFFNKAYSFFPILLSSVFLWGQSPQELFVQWDQDQNGRLTHDELPKFAQKNLIQVDQNQDGSISLDEHLKFLTRKKKAANSKEESIQILSNLPYADNQNPRQTLDLILPSNKVAKKKLPLIVWIHGGGWKNGDKKSGLSPHRIPALVKTGRYIGATIAYRLSGEAQWPAQIHDCKAAIRWLRGNADQYGIDPERIAVWGSSAGGHLVSMLGVTNRVKNLEGSIGKHLDQSSQVQAVVNYYGPCSLLQMNDHPSKIDHNAPGSPESQLIGSPIQQSKKKARQASPLHHVTADDASIIHFHGTDDPLVPAHQSTLFHRALKDKGVPSTLITLKGGGHSMPSTFTQSKVIPFLDFILYQKGKSLSDQTIPLNN
jgi:acetyl esterase/lipase